ncbi:hypothetical protein J6590_041110 [Homalodisca vitripennis]|nr:hypothetical protein J6590_041110 [Homalodisca vitripennis]
MKKPPELPGVRKSVEQSSPSIRRLGECIVTSNGELRVSRSGVSTSPSAARQLQIPVVLIANNNYIAAGDHRNIFKILEQRITVHLDSAHVVISAMPHQYNLPSDHPMLTRYSAHHGGQFSSRQGKPWKQMSATTHDDEAVGGKSSSPGHRCAERSETAQSVSSAATTNNTYIYYINTKHEPLLDLNAIGRFTLHGMHLSMRRKRLLAELLARNQIGVKHDTFVAHRLLLVLPPVKHPRLLLALPTVCRPRLLLALPLMSHHCLFLALPLVIRPRLLLALSLVTRPLLLLALSTVCRYRLLLSAARSEIRRTHLRLFRTRHLPCASCSNTTDTRRRYSTGLLRRLPRH